MVGLVCILGTLFLPLIGLATCFYLEGNRKICLAMVSETDEVREVRAQIHNEELHGAEFGKLANVNKFVGKERG